MSESAASASNMASFSYREMLDAMRRRDDERQQFSSALRGTVGQQLHLDIRCRSCLSIGSGIGELDLEFIDQFLPDLRTLTAIEPDSESAGILGARLKERLPHVASVVFQGGVQDWPGVEEKMDIVLMFHSIYYVPAAERSGLLNRLFHNVMRSGGYVVVLVGVDYRQSSNIMEVIRQLKPDCFEDHADADELDQLMMSVGFKPYYDHVYSRNINVEGVEDDDAFLSLYLCETGTSVTLEQLRQTASRVFRGRSTVTEQIKFSVFKKP